MSCVGYWFAAMEYAASSQIKIVVRETVETNQTHSTNKTNTLCTERFLREPYSVTGCQHIICLNISLKFIVYKWALRWFLKFNDKRIKNVDNTCQG